MITPITKRQIKNRIAETDLFVEVEADDFLEIIKSKKSETSKLRVDSFIIFAPAVEEDTTLFMVKEDLRTYLLYKTEEEALKSEMKVNTFNKFECAHDWSLDKTVFYPNGRVNGVDASYIPELVEVMERDPSIRIKTTSTNNFN